MRRRGAQRQASKYTRTDQVQEQQGLEEREAQNKKTYQKLLRFKEGFQEEVMMEKGFKECLTYTLGKQRKVIVIDSPALLRYQMNGVVGEIEAIAKGHAGKDLECHH